MYKSPDRNSALLADLEDALKSNRLTMPSLPDVALQMRKVLDSPKSTSLEVVRTVGKDPAIAARLMKVANSALYRAKRPIEDMHTAVTRLGMVRVRYLVTSLAVLHVFKPLKGATDRLMRRLSAHSIQVAASCHTLALQCRTVDPHQAMLAGLIHDIGYLPLLQKAAEMPELSHDEGLLRGMLHQLHTTAGAAVLRSWSFPCELIDVVLEHRSSIR